ncbi:MAG: cadherin domain-containing protein, partial [Vampirovibrionales bacterium]
TYTLTDNAGGRFAINSTTGVVTVANSSLLDFESATTHSIQVRVTDAGGLSQTLNHVIKLTNVNEAPNSLTLLTGNELIANGGFEAGVGTDLGSTANNWSGTYRGRHAGRPYKGSYYIPLGGWETSSGRTLSQTITTEIGKTYELSFYGNVGGHGSAVGGLLVQALNGVTPLLNTTVTDSTLNSGYQKYTFSFTATSTTTEIKLTDTSVIQAGGDVDFDIDNISVQEIPNVISVQENSANGTIITVASANDPDAGQTATLTYTLTDNAGGRFAINSTTGVVTVADSGLLDFESATTHTITVRVTDAGGLYRETTQAIAITNQNKAPNTLSITQAYVPVLNASFEDKLLGEGGWSTTPPQWRVGGFAGDFNPTNIDITSQAIDGQNVGFINAGQYLTQRLSESLTENTTYNVNFSLTTRNNLTAYNMNAMLYAGSTLLAQQTYAVSPSIWRTETLSFNSNTLGTGSGLYGQPLEIRFATLDVAQGHVDAISLTKNGIITSLSVAENSANGTTVATFSGTDPDAGQTATLTYSLTNNAGGRFAINSSTGIVTVANSSLLDFESATTHNITVRVTDAGGLTRDLTQAITITDVIGESLTGTSGNDMLRAGLGNDSLNGLAGTDTLIGGVGNDTYYVDNTNDVVIENLNEGTDTVWTTANYTLSSNIEILANQSGSGLALTGNDLNNTIYGNAGNDTLDGGTGNDTLEGGAGDDIYFLDSSGDTIIEAINAGIDEARITGSFSYTLTNNVENGRTLFSTAASNLTGNSLNNILYGNAFTGGLSVISGGAGNDTLYAVGNNRLLGGTGDDTLYGVVDNTYAYGGNTTSLTETGTGNDVLYGGVGTSYLYGQDGNDTLVSAFGGDLLDGGSGDDLLISSVIENASFNMKVDTINPGSGNDTIIGGDFLTQGQTGRMRINLTNSNNPTDGGNDTLSGSQGSLTPVVATSVRVTVTGLAGDSLLRFAFSNAGTTLDGSSNSYATVQVLLEYGAGTVGSPYNTLRYMEFNNTSGTGSSKAVDILQFDTGSAGTSYYFT